MPYNRLKEHRLILKLSVILALFLITVLFYFFPDFESKHNQESVPLDIQIFVQDIPRTRQDRQRPIRKRRRVLSLAIPVPAESEDFPEEITMDSLIAEVGVKGRIPSFARGVEVQAKPVLEIYPEVKSVKCKGMVKLLLLINRSGNVEQVEVVEDSTRNPECLEKAKEAARLSKWIPARVRNQPVNSWVVKIYKFNID